MEFFITLQEVGRVLSSRNEKALRSAVDVINTILSRLEKGEVEQAVAEKRVAEALREAAEMSFDDTRTLVSGAVRTKYPSTSPDLGGPYIQDIFDDFVVYRDSATNDLFKVGYVVTDGAVTLGDTQKVIERRDYVPVQESFRETEIPLEEGAIPLVEKAVRPDGTIPVRVVKPGWGNSGYYDAALLKREANKAFPPGTKMYWDHPTEREERERPERSLRDLAAETIGPPVYQENGPVGPGVYTNAKVFGAYRDAIDELAPHIGVSLRAYGKAKHGEREGRKGPIVESFLGPAASVDFVTTAGAGGEVLSLFEAKRGRNFNPIQEEDDEVSQEQLQEAQRLQQEAEAKAEAESKKTRRLQEHLAIRDARDHATELFASDKAKGLPEVTRTRLLESVADHVTLTDAGELDVAKFEEAFGKVVQDELTYIKALTGSTGRRTGTPRGMGTSLSEGFRTTAAASDEGGDDGDIDAKLEEGFKRLGLSESAAKHAAVGRN